jgi:hypothetical protein
VLDCEVLAVEPNRTLSYTWNFETRTGSHLRMEQSGFRPEQKQAYGGTMVGWQQFFAKRVALADKPSGWGVLALLPLVSLKLTGLNLFVLNLFLLPYGLKWRSRLERRRIGVLPVR